jgi:hypothetical protein
MNEPLHDGLDSALQRLREEVEPKGASDALEEKLLRAFRAQHTSPKKHRAWMWVPAAVAASLAVVAVSRYPVAVKSDPPKVAERSVPSPTPAQSFQPLTKTAAGTPKRTARRRIKRASPPLAVAESRPATKQQDFVPIPYAPPFAPYDEGQVVRVNMAGSSARRMGVPVMMDRVQADLVVGNDGMARAIRVVSTQGSRVYE